MGSEKIILNVPYYSQHLDVEDEKWKSRACGVVCLKMVMDFYNKYTPPLMALVYGVEARGGFGTSGWIHDVVIKTAKEYDFNTHRKEHNSLRDGIEEILDSLNKENPVIASAVKNFSEAEKFHMVVLVGFKKSEDELDGFYYHDPDAFERSKGMYKFVPIETFKKHWRKMAIYVRI